VTSLAALALYDGGAEISSDNIKALLDASNNKVAPYWPGLFAGLVKGSNIERLLFSLGGGGGGVAPASIAAAGGAAADGEKEEKKEEKPKVEEVDALDGGMDMFGGGGGGGDY
jgi:ribosomal protein L12E/L44/L45/RPP1/RPP2